MLDQCAEGNSNGREKDERLGYELDAPMRGREVEDCFREPNGEPLVGDRSGSPRPGRVLRA